MAIRLVVARAINPVVMGVSDPLSVTISFNLLVVTDSVPEISGMDLDMFTLVRVEVPIFRDSFWFLVEF